MCVCVAGGMFYRVAMFSIMLVTEKVVYKVRFL